MKKLFISRHLVFIKLLIVFCALTAFGVSASPANASTGFISTWKTDNPGVSSSTQITIPTSGTGYNYNVDWGDGNSDTGDTGNATHTYATSGTYTVTITGTFPGIMFGGGGDKQKILSVTQWGTGVWSVFNFFGCTNLTFTATDVPDLSGVTDLTYALRSTGLTNEDLSGWNVSHVTLMLGTFQGTQFNGNITTWDVSHVTDFAAMFYQDASFNQNIGGWNVSSATDMSNMFFGDTAFDQNLSAWNVTNVTDMSGMFDDLGQLSSSNFDALLIGWAAETLHSNVTFSAGASMYCSGASALTSIVTNYNWTVSSGGSNCNAFILKIKTNNSGVSGPTQITIPTYSGQTYSYNVNWGDGTINTGETGDATHSYPIAGTYTVTITGTFPGIYFNDGSGTDSSKVLSIEHWGTNPWVSMYSAFSGCGNLVDNATDTPDLSGVTNTAYMFLNDTHFNTNINSWDMSHVTTMYGMFQSATAFNQPLNSWNLSSATDMRHMFDNAAIFNQDLSSWDVSHVTDMNNMFLSAVSFNQNIGSWNTSNVTDMSAMFYNAPAFNQNISSWNVSRVTNMAYMFNGDTAFNQNIGGWNVSLVTNMDTMFGGASSFNQNLSAWDVSNVTNISGMFKDASHFNNGGQALSWGSKLSHVTNADYTFANDSAFNQDISGWDVSAVTSMDHMFSGATAFNQNLSAWNVANVTNMGSMLSGTGLSSANYDALLIGWAGETLHSSVTLDAGSLTYCAASTERASIISTYSWTISDGGVLCHTLRYTAGANGSITGSSTQIIGNNSNGTAVTAVPSSGYLFSSWSDNSTQNPRTDTSVTADVSVTANFSSAHSSGNGGYVIDRIYPSAVPGTGDLDFSINDGATHTNIQNLSISMNANPSTVKGYAISLSPTLVDAGINTFTKNAQFTLPNTSGTYTLYLVYVSSTGDHSPILSHSIIYTGGTVSSTTSTALSATSSSIVFARNLRKGSVGNDVKELQKFLNSKGFVVAVSGPGSVGNETNLYGSLTAAAVSKFQEAYSADILAPVGLKNGTGNFYSSTRSYVNKLMLQ